MHRGLFQYSEGALTAIANRHIFMPGSTNFFRDFDPERSDSCVSNVAFHAQNDLVGEGALYAYVDEVLHLVADESTTAPGVTNKFSFLFTIPPTIEKEKVVFMARYIEAAVPDPEIDGIYLWEDGLITTIARDGDIVPGTGGALKFTHVARPLFSDGRILFQGHNSGTSLKGWYMYDGTNSKKVVDSTDMINGAPFNVPHLERGMFGGNDIAFYDHPAIFLLEMTSNLAHPALPKYLTIHLQHAGNPEGEWSTQRSVVVEAPVGYVKDFYRLEIEE